MGNGRISSNGTTPPTRPARPTRSAAEGSGPARSRVPTDRLERGPDSPTRTPADARRIAETFWIARSSATQDFRQIERDPYDVNGPASGLLRTVTDEQGRRRHVRPEDLVLDEVKANTGLEAQALANLSPAQIEQYHAVAAITQGDPHARLALQILLVEGTLTAQPLARDGQELLSVLHGLGRQELAPGLDRAALVSDLVQEIAMPSAISQRSRGTCTVTSIQILTATQRPAEYARLVAGLSAPAGTVTLANGRPLSRLVGTERDDLTNRTQSSRLWQAAFMEYGNGEATYDNVRDRHSDTGKSGLSIPGISHVLSGVFASDLTAIDTWGQGTEAKEAMLSQITAALGQTRGVLASLRWGVSGENGENTYHEVLVTRQEGDRVYYVNPWGIEESMSQADFKDRIYAAHLLTAPRRPAMPVYRTRKGPELEDPTGF